MASLNITTTPNSDPEEHQSDTIHVTTPVRTSGRKALPRPRPSTGGVPPEHRKILPNTNKHSTTTEDPTPQPKRKRVASIDTPIPTGQGDDTVIQADSDGPAEEPAEEDPAARKRQQNAASQRGVRERRLTLIAKLQKENAVLKDKLEAPFEKAFARWAEALTAKRDQETKALDAELDQRLGELEAERIKDQEALATERAREREALEIEFAKMRERLESELSRKQVAQEAEFVERKCNMESDNARRKKELELEHERNMKEVQAKQAEWEAFQLKMEQEVLGARNP
ncbi:hypothetical protein F5Y17DRAFT_157123 [Xylariaceae sp. FL0594]|nr:hypothetical protein F5Y17DRAFT_157123 [Xylariaceae sp. FL0594]